MAGSFVSWFLSTMMTRWVDGGACAPAPAGTSVTADVNIAAAPAHSSTLVRMATITPEIVMWGPPA